MRKGERRSEPLRSQQRVSQINQQADRNGRSERIVKDHDLFSSTVVRRRRCSRWQQRKSQTPAPASERPSWNAPIAPGYYGNNRRSISGRRFAANQQSWAGEASPHHRWPSRCHYARMFSRRLRLKSYIDLIKEPGTSFHEAAPYAAFILRLAASYRFQIRFAPF
jgi:hypothetical protein